MKNVTQAETDTFAEVNKVLNDLIDNQRLMEGKILALDQRPVAVIPKQKPKRSGKVSIWLLVVLGILAFATMAHGYVPNDINFDIASNPNTLAQYLRDSFANVTSETYIFTPRATAPTGTTVT